MSIDILYTSVIFIVLFVDCAVTKSCSSSSICTSIYDCPPLLDLYNKDTLSPTELEILQNSQCSSGTGNKPYVCCKLESTTVSNGQTNVIAAKRSNIASNGNEIIIPGRGSCGVESYSDRIIGGTIAAIDEFPWMALLEYSNPRSSVPSLSCGGVLINQRYVLTAAHCLVGKIREYVGKLVKVRLGEYDTTTALDCIKGYCSDPVLTVGIEEIIPHFDFNVNILNGINDIGLIRLSEDVQYSDFVQPICLPSTLGESESTPTSLVYIAGWGKTSNGSQSNVKRKVKVPIVSHLSCREKFATLKKVIADSQICAGGNAGEDSCKGDSGGPLMKFSGNYWLVEGIVSFGYKCGELGWPGVYTKVSSFDDWIKSNMRP